MDSQDRSLKAQVLAGLIWKFGERILVQLVSFVISIILARLLLPDAFGLIAMCTVFITLANAFVTNGFGNSLIQKENADETDFSSVFYFSVVFSAALYMILFFAAPAIAQFYRNEMIVPVLRVMGLRIVIGGVNSVQYAYVSRHMLFRRFFFSTLGGTVVSAVIAFAMAYHGYGVWALVEQYVVNALIDTAILWVTVRWRPQRVFSWQRMRGLFSYGWKLLVSSLINTGYSELRSLIIGRMYSAADLAFYTKGKNLPELVTYNIVLSIDSVLFPAVSKKQREPEKVKTMTRRSINTAAYLLMPLMFGLAAVAKPLVLLLLTEKWLFCVPYIQIACWSNALLPIQTANLQAIKAMGRSDIILRLEVIKKSFGIVLVLLVMPYGVLAIALSVIAASTFFSVVNAAPNARLLGYSYREQMRDVLPYVAMSFFMAACVYPLQYLDLPLLAVLALQVLLGGAVYLLQSLLFKVESFQYILQTALHLLKGEKGG